MTTGADGVFAATLVDEWVRAGVVHAVLSPGSRSTPLALAVAERLETHVFHDERSAGFFALGIGAATGTPAIVLCTSGTAAANLHPAVIEADASRVPMVVCTADRPPELRDTGANQAIDQTHLYGRAVRWFCDPGVPERFDGASKFWRSVAARASAEAAAPAAGPVHCNLPFREPFDLSPPAGPPAGGRPGGHPWTRLHAVPAAGDPEPVIRMMEQFEEGVILAGRRAGVTAETIRSLSEASGWPVLADPLSGLRVEGTITAYDGLVRSEDWAASHYPLAVLRVGEPVTSKLTNRWLANVYPHVVVGTDVAWLDPHRAAGAYVLGDPDLTLQRVAEALRPRKGAWAERWRSAERAARRALDGFCDGLAEHFEGAAARDVIGAVPAGAAIFVGSSMPVRDVESFAAAPVAARVYGNRGASGIDGTLSTALGLAAGGAGPVVALAGDLAFLHDANGLIGAAGRGLDMTVVVLANDGGGIFHFLPQAAHRDFERLFGTPHGVDVAAVAELHGVPVERPGPGEVASVVARSVAAGGVRVVVIDTDRRRNVELHQAAWEEIRRAVASGGVS